MYKELKKILNESLVNPDKASGVLKLILDANDPDYFERRALELIQEAREFIHLNSLYHNKIKMAITLLALARLQRRNEEKNEN